ncbi:MAG TPA: ABC transporter substrate-binding protein, partial [Chloroflexota bacterium]
MHDILRSLAIVGLSLALVLTGCSGSSAPASAQTSALHIPLYGAISRTDPEIFDGAQASASTPLFLTSLLNAGLVKFGPDLHVIPEIAVSIPTISTGGRSYTFTIRQDAEFADGEPCTAADVAYSLARALMPGEHSPLAWSYLGGIKGAAAVARGRA